MDLEKIHKTIILKDLPKISLNKWYSSQHWSKRKQQKDNYIWLIKSQTKVVFPKNRKYFVDYEFHFKSNPLDASNCVGLIKLVEDILFEDDKWDIILKISISSLKDKTEFVKIIVNEL